MQASSPLPRSRRGVLLCLIAPILICYLILTSSFTSDDVPIIAVGSQAAVLTLQNNNNNNHGTTNDGAVVDTDAVASSHQRPSLRHDPDQIANSRQRTMRRTSSSSSGRVDEAQHIQEQESQIPAEHEDPVVPKKQRSAQQQEHVAGSLRPFSSSSPFFSRLDRSWNRTCLRTIQRAVSQWQRCVDPKVPASSLHLKWKSPPNHCRFEVRPVKEAQAISLMWMWAMEAHGDSTLREIMKLFVGYFEMGGSLEKKDANQTLRDAKFFVKPFQSFPVSHLIVHPSKHQDGGGQAGDAFRVVHNSHMQEAARLVAARLDKQVQQQHRFALSELPAAYRVMFRFDFVPVSLAEPMALFLPRDLVLLKPPASLRSFPVESRFSFFDRTPRRLLLLSLGSHTAKLHVADPAVRDRFGKQLLKQNAHSRNLLFHLFIADLEDYLILRVLGLHVTRPLSSERLHEAIDTLVKAIPSEIAVRPADHEEPPLSPPLESEESTAPVDLVLLLQQMLECHSMQDSVKHAFQRMSVFCEPMHQVVRNINHEIDVYFGLSAEDQLEEWHPNSALRLLSVEQRAVLHSRVMVVPPIDCHGGRTFQYALHKPYCTRDGIHLRNKFLGIQLDMILNVLSQAEECL